MALHKRSHSRFGSGRSGFWRNHRPRDVEKRQVVRELQRSCRAKRRRALQGCNHAEGQSGGLIEPMSSSAGCSSLALHTDDQKESSDDRPACLENPRSAGAESTLTENVASPFQAEPRQFLEAKSRKQEIKEQMKSLQHGLDLMKPKKNKARSARKRKASRK